MARADDRARHPARHADEAAGRNARAQQVARRRCDRDHRQRHDHRLDRAARRHPRIDAIQLLGNAGEHGVRASLRHRRGDGLPQPPGRRDHRRRVGGNADGRFRDAEEIQPQRQDHRHQEQHARPDQVGADGVPGQSRVRLRARADRVHRRGEGLRDRHDPHRRPGAVRRAAARGAIAAGAVPDRSGGRPVRAADAAEDRGQAGDAHGGIARQGNSPRDEDGADPRVRYGPRAGVMDGEPRLATRAPDGQVLREWDRYPAEAARALHADLERALGAAVEFDAQAKALYATDASNYRQVPIGVVTPRSRDEAVEAVRIAREHDAPIVARGGGTSLAGQGCNVALCIDFSRHLHHVIEVDPVQRLARVEPGCILDRLRDAAAPHGLTFGPDPATHDHNTLGGMIGNDSCGVHSVKWGRTIDNVERLVALTYDGLQLELGPTPRLDRATDEIGRRGDIYRALVALRDRYGSLVEERFPKIPRLVSGFEGLAFLLPDTDFNVARAVTGTEGTCVIVLEAEVQLVPRPQCKALGLLSFDDVYQAADAVPALLEQDLDAVEGFDGRMYDAIKRSKAVSGVAAFPEGRGFLIVEAGGDSLEQAEANVRRMVGKANTGAPSAFVSDPRQQQRIWEAREAALGVTAFVPGGPEHWPGWEDSAVPPDRLGDYLRELDALLAEHGYTAALYGHFGVGVTHGRINFDLDRKSVV